MFSVKLRGAGEKAITTSEANGDKLCIWQLRLAYANRKANNRMMKIKAVIGFGKVDL